jgi:hypothetical protein
MYTCILIHSAKKETHKGILSILNQNFSVTLLDIDSECLLLKNYQSILQKLSKNKSQFSTLQVTLKLVPCMTTTGGQHCSAPPRHRLNQISHIVYW